MAFESPYPAGSDLHHLYGWAYRIGLMIDNHEQRTDCDWMIFRPTECVDDAMMRYMCDYPELISHLKDTLKSTNEAFAAFKLNQGKVSAATFTEWLEILERRITKACELINAREAPIDVNATAPCHSDDDAGQTYLTRDLCKELGDISSATLTKYVRLANVRPSRQGERDRRFTSDERARIAAAIAEKAPVSTARKAREILSEIERKPKARN